jgi:serine/threonine protein phosphatase PrpC
VVNSTIYSKRLYALIEELHATGNVRYIYAPKELLVDAVKQNTEIGSCTCVIVTLDAQSPVIHTVNLGDSGYMILRRESMKDELKIAYESKEQHHSFNFPFQVGTKGDNPTKGNTNAHSVNDGDILGVGSDGLWDNMRRHKIV